MWLVCLLFFQLALLGGYVYAHGLGRLSSPARQAAVHALLLGLALAVVTAFRLTPEPTGDPALAILSGLAAGLGLPVVLLGSTSPLLQRWAAGPRLEDRGVYRLFAVSNFGSLLGLWCYPFLVEPWTTLETQRGAWSYGYGAFVLLALATCLRAARTPAAESISRHEDPGAGNVDPTQRTLWLALPAVAALHLFATSNQLTRNVASVPFLWVLPLSLYILSFVATFESPRWYVRWLFCLVFLLSLGFVLHFLLVREEPDFRHQLAVYSTNLFSGCMVCHGELARLRPSARHLTRFYLYVATGGALGGLFVSVVAPRLFTDYWEYPLALVGVYLIGGAAAVVSMGEGEEDAEEGAGLRRLLGWGIGGVCLVGVLALFVAGVTRGALHVSRNFFGVLRVYDHYPETERWQRYLLNGAITHGSQLLSGERRREPTLYYGRDTGIGLALGFRYERGPDDGGGDDGGDEAAGRRVAVVGLGAGTLAAFGEPGDRYRFYELNPQVIDVAREYFTYLEDSEAEVTVVEGDGRLMLERELRDAGGTGHGFDVIALDAFTGDAVPVHLLTKEAFAIYRRHLGPEGVIAVHVSNLHFDLKPVVRAQAEALGSVAVLVESDADEERNRFVSDWVLVTGNARFLADPELQSRWSPFRADEVEPVEEFLWTDDFHNLFRLLQ